MKAKQTTDDLIRQLAEAQAPAPMAPGAAIGAILIALAIPLLLFWLVFGLRPDLGAAIPRLAVQAKTALPLALAALAIALAMRSGRPGRRIVLWPLALPVMAGLALVMLRVAAGPDAPLMAELVGTTALSCLASITLLSALPLWVALSLLRQSAPTRPGLTGALLGLAVGAAVASGYALHCTEDSPLFFMAWYGLAIGSVAAAGAGLGRKVLRW